MIVLETARLRLHKIALTDAKFYLQLFNSKAWIKYIGDRNVHTISEAESYIKKNYFPSYEKYGYGSYTVQLKETNETIGACGLYRRENLDYPDIGFSFLGEHLGKGYGFESASALMDYARQHFGVVKILGFTMEENKASISLLKKLGLHETGTYQFENEKEELLLFSN